MNWEPPFDNVFFSAQNRNVLADLLPAHHFVTRRAQPFPDLAHPRLVLRLHQHRAQAGQAGAPGPSPLRTGELSPNHDPGNCTRARCNPRAAHASKTFRACSEAFRRVRCMQCPHHDVQLRRVRLSRVGCPRSLAFGDSGTHEPKPQTSHLPAPAGPVPAPPAVPRLSPSANAPSFVSGRSRCVAHSATAAAPAREHSRLISPRCNCIRREVGVRRIVLVEPPHRRVAEQHAPAAVRLQPVLVRIDHDGVGLADRRIGPPRRLVQRICNQPEVAAIGRVHMHPRTP